MSDQNTENQNESLDVRVNSRSTSGHATGHTVEIHYTEPTVDPGSVKPFASIEEQVAACEALTPLGQRRMNVDAAYRAEVEARIVASMGWSDGADRVPVFLGEQAPRQPRQDPIEAMKIQTEQPDGAVPFRTEDDMVRAMSDPRYRTDPHYRAGVDRRVAVTL